MKAACLPVAALTAFLVTLVPNLSHAPAPATVSMSVQAESRRGDGDSALDNLESWMTNMKSDTAIRAAAGRSAGNLWMEIQQLKRSGQDVGRFEWRVSELEESLRNQGQDASARRRIVSDLELEMQLLKQRGR